MKLIAIILVAALAMVMFSRNQTDKRIDKPEGSIKLIVRGDDMASFHATNIAFQDCYKNRILRSAEIMVPFPWFPEARELAIKTILLLGKDYEKYGALHEYYLPDNGEPVLNKGFQNWNYLVLSMIAWMEGKPVVEEF